MQGPEYWRKKANEYQTFAEQTNDEEIRAAYLTLAQNCQTLADRQAKINGQRRETEN